MTQPKDAQVVADAKLASKEYNSPLRKERHLKENNNSSTKGGQD